jgi:hypothetical protein
LGLILRSLIHFELTLVQGDRHGIYKNFFKFFFFLEILEF